MVALDVPLDARPVVAPTARLALFDCDGTLVDSQRAIVAAMREACVAAGVPAPEPAAVRSIIGLSLFDAVARLLPDLDRRRHMRVVEQYRQAVLDGRQRDGDWEPLHEGAAAALDALDEAGILLGIATGKSRRGLDAVLACHGLTDRFVTVQTADTAPGKPNPDMVLRASAETGIDPAATVVIGDTAHDVAMARAAGARSIGVTWGYHQRAMLRSAGADTLVDQFTAVPGTVLSLLAH